MTATQEHRVASLTTALGGEVLLLRSATCSEELGRPFRFDLDLLSLEPSLEFADIVGKSVTIRLDRGENEPRYFNGVVSRFAQSGMVGAYYGYTAQVVPWVWILTRTSDCRIFQDMTVPEIIKQVFADRGFADFVDALKKTDYPKWEYCVQYRETDFNFISRLMEEEGIYYFFEHTEDKHFLVLADSPESHLAFPGDESMKYLSDQPSQFDIGYIREWFMEQELQPGKYALTDYDFKTPTKDLSSNHEVERPNANSTFEMFDFPGAYEEIAEGKFYSQVRIEELQAQFAIIYGRTDIRGACTGCTFKLENHPREDQLKDYLITSATYHIENDAMVASTGAGPATVYDCEFTAILAKTPFRSPRLTPKPIVQGPQTAIVVGPKDQEIYTDKYGRIKVHFHWDRHNKLNESASCWIRVAQIWAGSKWGSIHIPRIGQEVMVEFLEGDPDRPIITGRVYNGDLMPPYDLPGNMTQSGIKSHSSKDAGTEEFNEFRFEDLKGSEQIFLQAQRQLDIRVKADRFETIGNDRHLVVEKDKYEHIKNNRNELIDVDHIEEIKNDRNLKVGGKEAVEITKSKSLKVTGAVIEEFKDCHSEVVTKDYYLKADNICIEALTNITIKVGQSYIAIESGGIKIGTTGTIETESTGDTTLKATQNLNAEATLKMALKGTMGFAAESTLQTSLKGLQLGLEGTAMSELKGALTTVKADGIMTVQGALVKIN